MKTTDKPELMDQNELQLLEILDKAVQEETLKKHMEGVIQRVEKALQDAPDAMMSWEPIPLNLYSQKLPDEIKSCWVFNLRKYKTTGAERHPNSIQRMMSYKGTGDFQTKPGETWQSNFLESDRDKDVSKRWLSIPVNVWHQGVVSEQNWVVLSFHTVEVSELIEERADESNHGKMHSQKYVDKK